MEKLFAAFSLLFSRVSAVLCKKRNKSPAKKDHVEEKSIELKSNGEAKKNGEKMDIKKKWMVAIAKVQAEVKSVNYTVIRALKT